MARFTDRAMLKVYVERTDLRKLAERATANRRDVSEYVRDLLLEHLHADGDSENLRRVPALRVAERRASESERTSGGAGLGGSVPSPVLERPAARQTFRDAGLSREIADGTSERLNFQNIPAPKYGTACQHGAGPGLCRFSKCHNYPGKKSRTS
jgi:hypothetical protein